VPAPKARARVVRTKYFTGSYTPKKTKDFETLVRRSFEKHEDVVPKAINSISMDIVFYMPIPKYLRNKRVPGQIHNVKPDIDNLVKSIMDALNPVYAKIGKLKINIFKGAWKDDGMIYYLRTYKVYSDNPRTEVEIEYL